STVSAPSPSTLTTTSSPCFTPRDMTPRMLAASTPVEPGRPIRTVRPLSAAAWLNIFAGRACRPTFDATTTVRSGMAPSRPSGLDRDLDRLAARDDADAVERVRERQPVRDEVGDGHVAARDELEGLLVVRGARAVRTHDHQLAVVHEVRVERDDRVVLGQPAEEA